MTNRDADLGAPDFEALRARYRQERDRRAPSGPQDRRFHDIEQGFSHLLADPYGVAPERAPLDDDVDVLIVGGGFGGLLCAARLQGAGIEDVRIVESAGDFGGVWYWNRYPGAACDIESYIYLPLLEETGYMPVERYSKAPEIRAHCRRIAQKYRLYDKASFSTQVKSLRWDEGSARWSVRTDRQDRIRARFVILTTGPLNRPKLPAIPGIETFEGRSFHTSRWDYGYTGGGETEPLDWLYDKRVGVIGTGATAIQCVPPLAGAAERLFVFQRTPSSVDARNNSRTDPAWWASLAPGWQQARLENFTAQFTNQLPSGDEVGDGWTVLARAVRDAFASQPALAVDPGALLEQADLETMVRIRQRIDQIVVDPVTADALKPWFSLFCKRPCFSDEYLQAFNRPNVSLIDTAPGGVERITSRGVVVNGVSYELDCLIFATGFEVATSYTRRSGMEVHGVDGVSLSDKWSDGMATLHGLHTRGFPNCFVVSQAQAGMSPNFPHMLSEQSSHIAHIVQHCLAENIRTLEPSAEAEQTWVDLILKLGASRRKFIEGCTPGYYNNEGRLSDVEARNAPFGAGPIAFIDLLKRWREAGDFAGLERDGRISG